MKKVKKNPGMNTVDENKLSNTKKLLRAEQIHKSREVIETLIEISEELEKLSETADEAGLLDISTFLSYSAKGMIHDDFAVYSTMLKMFAFFVDAHDKKMANLSMPPHLIPADSETIH